MFSKALILVLLGATFAAALSRGVKKDSEEIQLRGLSNWLNNIGERVQSFVNEGRDNVVSILEKVRADRIKVTELTKRKLIELRKKMLDLKNEIKSEVKIGRKVLKNRLEKLKNEGAKLLNSKIKEELDDINAAITQFLEKRIHNGKQELISLMDEFKKILKEDELQKLNDKLEEEIESDNEKVQSPVVENEQHNAPHENSVHDEDENVKSPVEEHDQHVVNNENIQEETNISHDENVESSLVEHEQHESQGEDVSEQDKFESSAVEHGQNKVHSKNPVEDFEDKEIESSIIENEYPEQSENIEHFNSKHANI